MRRILKNLRRLERDISDDSILIREDFDRNILSIIDNNGKEYRNIKYTKVYDIRITTHNNILISFLTDDSRVTFLIDFIPSFKYTMKIDGVEYDNDKLQYKTFQNLLELFIMSSNGIYLPNNGYIIRCGYNAFIFTQYEGIYHVFSTYDFLTAEISVVEDMVKAVLTTNYSTDGYRVILDFEYNILPNDKESFKLTHIDKTPYEVEYLFSKYGKIVNKNLLELYNGR